MNKRLLMLVALLGGCATGFPVTPPDLTVITASRPPEIDGRLDDACWQGQPQISDFKMLVERNAKPAAPTQRTEAWLAADEDALYVAVKCYDNRMDLIKAVETGHDAPVWRDDCVELFVMAGDMPPYFHFIANLANARYDARCGATDERSKKTPARWDGNWSAASQRAKDHWTMEFAIPFACLELGAARVAQGIRFNIGREQRRLMEVTCWPASGFHEYKEYARMKGLHLDPQRYGLVLKDVVTSEGVPGPNRFTATVAEEPEANAPMILRASVRPLPDGRVKTTTAQAVSFPGARLDFSYPIPLAAQMVMVTVEGLDRQGRARASATTVLRVPSPIDASLVLPLLYRSDGVVQLSGRLAISPRFLEKARFEMAIATDSKTVSTSSIRTAPADGRFYGTLPIAKLPPGQYAVIASLTAPELSAEPITTRFPFELMAGPLEK